MAITILSEQSYTSTITSTLLSPFMYPLVRFKVSGAAAVTPEAEIEFAGSSETVTIDAIFIETISDEHYFQVDLSDVMKYLMQRFDNILKPDNLEFINGDLLQLFDEYFLTQDMDIYFSRDTGDEQTLTQSNTWLYLANQIPSAYGFNLWNIRTLANLTDLKWSNNTYNALFMWLPNVATTIKNLTKVGTLYTGTPTAGFYQWKFAKNSAGSLLQSGMNTIEVKTTGEITKTFVIDYDPDCSKTNLCWQHPTLGYASYPFNLITNTNISSSKGSEIDKYLTTMQNVNALKEVLGYDEQRKIVLTAKVDYKYWDVVKTIYSSRHVYLYVGADGANDSSLTWVECIISGGCSLKSDKAKNLFTVELTLPETFNIKF